MLSYAFQSLERDAYKGLAAEKYDNVAELCAAILAIAVKQQIKRSLGREYITYTEPLSSLRGKIEISESLRKQTLMKRQLVCSHDEFSINTRMNQIIKTTMALLVRSNISKARKKPLKSMLPYFSDVSLVDPNHIDWHFRYNRQNKTYELVMFICKLTIDGLLLKAVGSPSKLETFADDQKMHRLYEKFILMYYKKEHPELRAEASQIPWALDNETDSLLPIMQSDITLSQNGKILIIDAKYYSHMTQEHHGKHTAHSGNLYQLFTYVKNKQISLPETAPAVSGMLLYARTDEDVVPNNVYQMSGNEISVKSLDLRGDFQSIRRQLDAIANSAFNR